MCKVSEASHHYLVFNITEHMSHLEPRVVFIALLYNPDLKHEYRLQNNDPGLFPAKDVAFILIY